jgi:hypothetical protein
MAGGLQRGLRRTVAAKYHVPKIGIPDRIVAASSGDSADSELDLIVVRALLDGGRRGFAAFPLIVCVAIASLGKAKEDLRS